MLSSALPLIMPSTLATNVGLGYTPSNAKCKTMIGRAQLKLIHTLNDINQKLLS